MTYHIVSFMSQSCHHFLFIQSLYSFSNLLKIFFTSLFIFLLLLSIVLRCNHQKMLLTVYITNNNSLPEAIFCCLQMCNVASEVMVGDASLIGIDTTINQLETNVLLIKFIA